MKLKNIRLITILSAVLFFTLTGIVSARYYSSGFSYDYLDYTPYGAADYVTDQAEDYWNNSRANTHIGQADGSPNPVYWNEYSYSWYGQYRLGTGEYSIRLNRRTLAEDASDWGLTEFGLGINSMVHELGHALHLAHPSSHEATGNDSIMSYERQRDEHAPRTLDVNNLINYRGY